MAESPAVITIEAARSAPLPPGRLSPEMMRHGSLEVRFYAPRGSDPLDVARRHPGRRRLLADDGDEAIDRLVGNVAAAMDVGHRAAALMAVGEVGAEMRRRAAEIVIEQHGEAFLDVVRRLAQMTE